MANTNLFINACREGNLGLARWSYLNMTDTPFNANASFIEANMRGYLNIMQRILSVYAIDATIIDYCLRNIRENDLGTLQFLLENGANVHSRNVASSALTQNERDVLTHQTNPSFNKIQIAASRIDAPHGTLLKRFASWGNKHDTHEILLKYCNKEDYQYLDPDIIQNIFNRPKNARAY